MSNNDGTDRTAIFVRASAILGYYLAKSERRDHFKGNKFGLLEYVRPGSGELAIAKQNVKNHSTADSQRDLDPTWYDDYAEDVAEDFRRSMGQEDQAMGEWAENEQEKVDSGRKAASWFNPKQRDAREDDELGNPIGQPKPKGGRNRDRRDWDEHDDPEDYIGHGRSGGGRGMEFTRDYDTGRAHDGSCLEPIHTEEGSQESKEQPKQEQGGDIASGEDDKKGKSTGVLSKIAKIGCLGALFWAPVAVHDRLKKAELSAAEQSKKQEIIYNLSEKYPLSQFEREFCTIHNFSENPVPFARDSKGNVLLEEIGKAGKERVDVGAKKSKKKNKKKEVAVDDATKITTSLKDKLDIEFKPVAAETGLKAQRDSLIANCEKALPDHFIPDENHLKAFEAVKLVPFEPPDLSDEKTVDGLIRDAVCNMDKSKSSGSDGFARGKSLKGGFLEADLRLVIDAAKRRLARLSFVGENVGLFTGAELVRHGLRGRAQACL